MNTFPIINAYLHSDVFGKLIFWALFFLSVISWIIFIHKIWLSKKLNNLNAAFEKKLNANKDNMMQANLLSSFSFPYFDIYKSLKEKAFEILNKNRFFIENDKNVYLSGSDIELLDAHLASEIIKQTKKLEKNLFILPTVITLGPFLGLLGTVWGILLTFNSLQSHSLAGSNSSILSGLSMALATTVVGLLVAIPALIGYNYIKNWIKNFKIDMSHFSHELITSVEIQYRKVDTK